LLLLSRAWQSEELGSCYVVIDGKAVSGHSVSDLWRDSVAQFVQLWSDKQMPTTRPRGNRTRRASAPWARSGEGASAEMPRATGSLPNPGEYIFFPTCGSRKWAKKKKIKERLEDAAGR